MTKRQLIDEIRELNRTARADFLAQFGDEDLENYLSHLQSASRPRTVGTKGAFDKYFVGLPRVWTSPRRVDRPGLDDIVHKTWATGKTLRHGSTPPLAVAAPAEPDDQPQDIAPPAEVREQPSAPALDMPPENPPANEVALAVAEPGMAEDAFESAMAEASFAAALEEEAAEASPDGSYDPADEFELPEAVEPSEPEPVAVSQSSQGDEQEESPVQSGEGIRETFLF